MKIFLLIKGKFSGGKGCLQKGMEFKDSLKSLNKSLKSIYFILNMKILGNFNSRKFLRHADSLISWTIPDYSSEKFVIIMTVCKEP